MMKLFLQKNTTKPIDEDKYLCGTVDKNRRLNYLSCSEKSSFICETNPGKLN